MNDPATSLNLRILGTSPPVLQASTVEQLFAEEHLTKEATVEKNWVGIMIVRRLATVLFEHAMEKGTKNWDLTISKTMSIVLLGALATRVGDICKTKFDVHDLPFLAYKDVTLQLVGGDNIEQLVGQFVIRNEKNHK